MTHERPTGAYLFEPYARPANELLFDNVGVREGVRLLDVRVRIRIRRRRQHMVAAPSSQASMLRRLSSSFAHMRTPEADLRVGDMFALPFPGRRH